jgi:hypothetical protein
VSCEVEGNYVGGQQAHRAAGNAGTSNGCVDGAFLNGRFFSFENKNEKIEELRVTN